MGSTFVPGPTAQETQGRQTGLDAAAKLAGVGGGLTSQGASAMGAGTDYYKRLLSSPTTGQAAVAPAAANVNATFQGLKAGIMNGPQAGVQRDIALGTADRDRANAIARLHAGVQPAAASALTEAGAGQLGLGIGSFTGAGGLGSQVASQASQSRLQEAQLRGQLGQNKATNIGKSIKTGISLAAAPFTGGASLAGLLPATQTTSNTGSLAPNLTGGYGMGG